MRERPAGRRVMRQIWRQLGVPALAGRTRRDRARCCRPGWRSTPSAASRTSASCRSRSRSRAPALLGAPMAPAFHEINLRTYVHRGGRDPGVWFFSLDADQPAGRRGRAPLVRAAVLPRRHHARRSGRRRRLPLTPARHARRRFARATSRWGRWRPPRPARSSSSWPSATCCTPGRAAALRTARVHHAPYPLQPATATDVEQTLTDRRRAAAGRLRGAARRWSTTRARSTSRSTAPGPSNRRRRLDKPARVR